jgi:hypothetical protein
MMSAKINCTDKIAMFLFLALVGAYDNIYSQLSIIQGQINCGKKIIHTKKLKLYTTNQLKHLLEGVYCLELHT